MGLELMALVVTCFSFQRSRVQMTWTICREWRPVVPVLYFESGEPLVNAPET